MHYTNNKKIIIIVFISLSIYFYFKGNISIIKEKFSSILYKFFIIIKFKSIK